MPLHVLIMHVLVESLSRRFWTILSGLRYWGKINPNFNWLSAFP